MTNRPLLRAAAAAITIAGCLLVAAGSARAADTLTVAVSRSPLSLPFHIARARGFLEQAGADIRIVDCIGGHRCMQLMLTGEADAATVSDMVIMTRALQGNRFGILATFVTSDQDLKLVANRAAGIAAPADLAGKTIGYTPGSSSHYFLDTFLLVNGVTPDTVDSVAVAPESMADTLAEGRVAAVSTWQPWAQQALDRVDGAFAMDAEEVYTLTFNLVATKDAISQRTDRLQRLLEALVQAEDFIVREPAKARAILARRFDMDPATVERIWPSFDYRLGLAQSLIVTLESEASWARRRGVIEGDGLPNFLDYATPGPLLQVAPEAVTLVE